MIKIEMAVADRIKGRQAKILWPELVLPNGPIWRLSSTLKYFLLWFKFAEYSHIYVISSTTKFAGFSFVYSPGALSSFQVLGENAVLLCIPTARALLMYFTSAESFILSTRWVSESNLTHSAVMLSFILSVPTEKFFSNSLL